MIMTLYTTDEACRELVRVRISHLCLFDKNHRLSIDVWREEDRDALFKVLVKQYVLFSCQGSRIFIEPESEGHQRVRFRFDNEPASANKPKPQS